MDTLALIAQLTESEGFRSYVYQDSKGYWTIGFGRLVDRRLGGGITTDEALFLLSNDVKETVIELDEKLAWWRGLDEVRQLVVADMAFNLGLTKLLRFRRTLLAMQEGRFEDAAANMLDSKWARDDVPERAARLARMMETGEAPAA